MLMVTKLSLAGTMPTLKCYYKIGLLCLGLVLLGGCGVAEVFDYDAPPVQISGRVLYRGYPLNGGWIVFSADPELGAGSDMLMTEILSDGTFQAIDSRQSGLKPGYYRMAVTNHPSPQWSLPKRYCDPTTSGLKCQVEANQPLRLRIELE